ncbi:MAG: Hsp33 family molecular chaperone HslO [Spirochaetaceae bacterium]|nr:MAG: Hsp33 family molecular chaperone HslO [Spirochaetaceae bacterium]
MDMKLTPIEDEILNELFDQIAADGMDIFLLDDSYRGAVLHGTRLVNQMRSNHQLGILETLLLGHAYIAAGLLTSLVKGNDRVSMTMECDGPAVGFSVDSNAHGEIRGYLRVDAIPVDGPLESFNLAPFIGSGTLSVSRHLEMARTPFVGHVSLQYGNLAKDLAHYYVVSEQLPTAVSLSIQFDREGRVSGAGGLFIQALPGSSGTIGAELEQRVREIPSLGSLFAAGETPAHIINKFFGEFAPEVVGSRTIEFSCHCSKEHYGGYIGSLPDGEINSILEEGPFPLRVVCHNCNSVYEYSFDEIQRICDARNGERNAN